MRNSFLDKLLNRIDRVGQGDLQAYLQRLHKEKGFFETIFNTLQEGILVVNSRGQIEYLNHAVTTLLGIDPKAVGSPIAQYLKELDWPTLLAGGRVVNRDLEVFYPQKRYLHFYLVPLEAQDKKIMGYAVIFHDLTARQEQTQETIESEKLNAVMLLAAGVAHELGNPLNSLNIHLQLLERDLRHRGRENVREQPDSGKDVLLESVRVARSEVSRLDTIITHFLRAIRPSQVAREPAQVNQVVQESLAFLRPEITDRDVLVEENYDPQLPLIPLNVDQIKQAFYNLIKNAVQAMPRGGILQVQTAQTDSHVLIAFEDNGSGISVEDMAHITEPYFTRKAAGSGLGLFIVQRIIHDHGGFFELLSNPGQRDDRPDSFAAGGETGPHVGVWRKK